MSDGGCRDGEGLITRGCGCRRAAAGHDPDVLRLLWPRESTQVGRNQASSGQPRRFQTASPTEEILIRKCNNQLSLQYTERSSLTIVSTMMAILFSSFTKRNCLNVPCRMIYLLFSFTPELRVYSCPAL